MTDSRRAASAWQLSQAVAALQGARRRVLQDDTDLAADEGAIEDALGEASDDVDALLIGAVRACIAAEARAKEARESRQRIAERERRYMRRAASLRGAVFAALDVLDRKRLEHAEFTVTVGQGRARCIVTDRDEIPEKYWRTERYLETESLSDDVEAGEIVPGAELQNGSPTLRIRSR